MTFRALSPTVIHSCTDLFPRQQHGLPGPQSLMHVLTCFLGTSMAFQALSSLAYCSSSSLIFCVSCSISSLRFSACKHTAWVLFLPKDQHIALVLFLSIDQHQALVLFPFTDQFTALVLFPSTDHHTAWVQFPSTDHHTARVQFPSTDHHTARVQFPSTDHHTARVQFPSTNHHTAWVLSQRVVATVILTALSESDNNSDFDLLKAQLSKSTPQPSQRVITTVTLTC